MTAFGIGDLFPDDLVGSRADIQTEATTWRNLSVTCVVCPSRCPVDVAELNPAGLRQSLPCCANRSFRSLGSFMVLSPAIQQRPQLVDGSRRLNSARQVPILPTPMPKSGSIVVARKPRRARRPLPKQPAPACGPVVRVVRGKAIKPPPDPEADARAGAALDRMMADAIAAATRRR